MGIPACATDFYRPSAGEINAEGIVDCTEIPPCTDVQYRPLNGADNSEGYVDCVEIPPCAATG